jgi:hypothetical protein
MRIASFSSGLVALAALGWLVGSAPDAFAKESTQTETEAEFISFDLEASTITVKVRKPGKGAKPPKHLKLKKGKQASFNVEQEGSVLKRTTVKLQSGMAGKFTDLKAGRRVLVFWLQDPNDDQARLARSISVFVPPEEQGEDAGGQ